MMSVVSPQFQDNIPILIFDEHDDHGRAVARGRQSVTVFVVKSRVVAATRRGSASEHWDDALLSTTTYKTLSVPVEIVQYQR
jgi:hypothetical protein